MPPLQSSPRLSVSDLDKPSPKPASVKPTISPKSPAKPSLDRDYSTKFQKYSDRYSTTHKRNQTAGGFIEGLIRDRNELLLPEGMSGVAGGFMTGGGLGDGDFTAGLMDLPEAEVAGYPGSSNNEYMKNDRVKKIRQVRDRSEDSKYDGESGSEYDSDEDDDSYGRRRHRGSRRSSRRQRDRDRKGDRRREGRRVDYGQTPGNRVRPVDMLRACDTREMRRYYTDDMWTGVRRYGRSAGLPTCPPYAVQAAKPRLNFIRLAKTPEGLSLRNSHRYFCYTSQRGGWEGIPTYRRASQTGVWDMMEQKRDGAGRVAE
eukprot:Selendium_serpulae@DN5814_c0_g1_i1.p1